jgi:hypothetical protein
MTEVQELMTERCDLQLLNFRPGSTASAEGSAVSLHVRFWKRENHLFSRFALGFVTFIDSLCVCPRAEEAAATFLSFSLKADQHDLATCNLRLVSSNPVRNID